MLSLSIVHGGNNLNILHSPQWSVHKYTECSVCLLRSLLCCLYLELTLFSNLMWRECFEIELTGSVLGVVIYWYLWIVDFAESPSSKLIRNSINFTSHFFTFLDRSNSNSVTRFSNSVLAFAHNPLDILDFILSHVLWLSFSKHCCQILWKRYEFPIKLNVKCVFLLSNLAAILIC